LGQSEARSKPNVLQMIKDVFNGPLPGEPLRLLHSVSDDSDSCDMSSRTCSRGGPEEDDDDLDVVDAERNVKLSSQSSILPLIDVLLV
jgi:hypothetical protein